jgi:monovalent cation:H+ antiporter, CPA1 family
MCCLRTKTPPRNFFNLNHLPPGWVLLILIGMTALLSACTAAPDGNESGHASSLIVQTEELIITLLLVAALVSLVAQRLRIPYTVGLVLVGFGLTFLGRSFVPNVTSEVILVLLVPPLVFEAAFQLDLDDLLHDLPLVLVLAVPGVILTTLLVGGLVSLSAGLPLATALVFGALIAATDPVSVVALFRTLGVPKRLQVLLEGESLLNDGSAIVIFNLMLAYALTGQFNLGSGIGQFFLVAGGGIVIGVLAGWVVSRLIGQIDNYLIETTLTTVLAYGSYLLAEYVLGVSGVLAVVAAGLVAGKIGPHGMSPTTRIVVFNFWEYVAFLANSFIFLMIGLQIDLNLLINNLQAIFWGILAVMITRAIVVYGLTLFHRDIPLTWKNILFWGGLRGAISLALALSLAPNLPYRDQLQAMAFGVVLFTLLVEGLSMSGLIKRSGISRSQLDRHSFELHYARAAAMRAAQSRLERMNHEGLISDFTWKSLRPILSKRFEMLTEQLQTELESQPELRQEEFTDAWREMLRAQRSSFRALLRNHLISDDTYNQLVAEVDFLLADPESTWPELEDEEPSTTQD